MNVTHLNYLILILSLCFTSPLFAEEFAEPVPSPTLDAAQDLAPSPDVLLDDDNDDAEGALSVMGHQLLGDIKDSKDSQEIFNVLTSTFEPLTTVDKAALWRETSELIEIEILLNKKRSLREALSSYIKSDNNVQFQIPFSVGEDGRLSNAPSLRIFALDLLGVVHKSEADSTCRELVKSSDDVSEIAICLRNIAWGDLSDARSILLDKANELVRQANPKAEHSPALLHLFDVFVYTKDISAIPFLASLQTKATNVAFSEAAHLALYKIAQRMPNEVARVILDNPEYLNDYPKARADLLALVDISDATGREAVESYLLSKEGAVDELDQFVNIYPNRNLFLSDSLLTEYDNELRAPYEERGWGPRSKDSRYLLNRKYLDVVTSWVGDSRFSKVKEPILELQANLEKGVTYEDKRSRGKFPQTRSEMSLLSK